MKFGKRPNATDFGTILQVGRPPEACRILERTLRVVRVGMSDPIHVAKHFTLIFNNGRDEVICEMISIGAEYVMARYRSPNSSPSTFGLSVGVSLQRRNAGKVLRRIGRASPMIRSRSAHDHPAFAPVH